MARIIALFALLFWTASATAQSDKAAKSTAKNPLSEGVWKGKGIKGREAYKPKPERGSHLNVKVTPPEKKGADYVVLVEVYNRGKDHLAYVSFDISLVNQSGLEITAPVEAKDLTPNFSGAQFIKFPRVRSQAPKILEATVKAVRMVATDARDVQMPVYVDLVRK